MNKTIKKLENNITQITVADERFYVKDEKYVPSVSWISGFYPKGIAFYKWLADKGWDEAEAIKSAAGQKGSKVHLAIADLLEGEKVAMDAKYPTKDGEKEELSTEEYICINSFANWFTETKPKVIASETVVFSDKHNYAGTVDFVCEIAGQKYIVDFKTGQNIWPEHELQVSAYAHASEKPEDYKLAILQIGYRRNKAGWKFTEVKDKFHLFLAAREIWANEHANTEPKKIELPNELQILTKRK